MTLVKQRRDGDVTDERGNLWIQWYVMVRGVRVISLGRLRLFRIGGSRYCGHKTGYEEPVLGTENWGHYLFESRIWAVASRWSEAVVWQP